MACDHSDAIQVKLEELYEPSEGGLAGAPAVHIDGIEEKVPSEVASINTQEENVQLPPPDEQSPPVTHETQNVKTTYTTEDDEPKASLKDKLKDKMVQLGDKLRPKDAVEAKNADPHPGLM